MYRAMCEEVEAVETALEDVCSMIKEGHKQGTLDWQVEWTATVQKVMATNAGWAWHGFWTMVERNLVRPACQVSSAGLLTPDAIV
jgi:hypothetical protein